MNFTDKLRQLHEQATQGEWRTYSIFGPDYTEIHGMRKDGEVQVTDSQANATLICLLRNKVPELLALLFTINPYLNKDGSLMELDRAYEKLNQADSLCEAGET
jgi:hypothetical protein